MAIRIRYEFAEFVDRLGVSTATRDDWETFIVEHYFDEMTEQIRRDCGGMLLGRGADLPVTKIERERMRLRALQLRNSAP